ncbi:ATP-binding protein [Cupriavidus sp. Marseille-Q8015]
MPHAIEVPAETVSKWQEIVDMLAEVMCVPSALIMRVRPPEIEVFVSSRSPGNPYVAAECARLDTGLYCETVMKTRAPLQVPDALRAPEWAANPDIAVGMISYMGVPIHWPDGESFGTICVLDRKHNAYNDMFLRLLTLCRDILEADLAMLMTLSRQLEQREAKIQRLVDADIIGIFLWEVETQVIVEANDAFLRIVGYERADLRARTLRWTQLTPPEWLERDLRERLPILKRTGRLQPFEKEYLRKDGSRVPVLMGVARIEDGGHEAVAFMLDLTERKAAEAEARDNERRYREVQAALAHANRVTTMGQLAASIGHEMKQPIGACATNAEAGLRWLNAPTPDLDEARAAFERIRRDARRGTEILDHIRSLFRKAPLDMAALQINDAIREVISLTRAEALKHGVAMQAVLAPDLPAVHGDRVQVQQAVLNLVVNAIEAMRAMPDGARRLTVSTAWDGTTETTGAVHITVRDSGPGIAPAQRERLFEPFATTKSTGMGMGLSICNAIAQAHGGTLCLCEPGQDDAGGGAAFRLTLPARRDQPWPAACGQGSV